MKFKNILLLYKRSAYQIYFLNKNSSLSKKINPVILAEKKRFLEAHNKHYQSLEEVAKLLFTYGIQFDECYRGRKINYKKYDLVITVGGDGTFLEAARNCREQVLLGVNSAPGHSVGYFCTATGATFKSVLLKIMQGRYNIHSLRRLSVEFNDKTPSFEALNDVLVCHKNPAMLSRYYLQLGNVKEEQRSSGVWLATAVGSTGAIKSAGGKTIHEYSTDWQYLARELYAGQNTHYHLRGSILTSRQQIKMVSLMRQGMVFIDGAHKQAPFAYGTAITISLSPNPVKIIGLKR